jgi:hypothetical protein
MRAKFLQISFENSIRIKIITYSILIGTSPMIPVIFIDEMVAGFWWKRLVRDLAQSHNIQLTNQQISELLAHNGVGCSTGCSSILLYPIREFIREILFWLEVRRGVNLAARAYYSGILLNALFHMNDFNPEMAPKYAAAMAYATKDINHNLVKKVFENSLAVSKGRARELKNQIRDLRKRMRGRKGKADKRKVSRILGRIPKPSQKGVESNPGETLEDRKEQDSTEKSRSDSKNLIGKITNDLAHIPAEHFDHLSNRFIEGLINQGVVDSSADIQVS